MVLEVLGQRTEDLLQYALLGPTLEAAVARLVGRVAPGQVAPGSAAGAQDPEDAVEHVPRVPPRSAPPVLSARRRLWDERSQNPPLLVGKVHALSLLCLERRLADHYMPLRTFMR